MIETERLIIRDVEENDALNIHNAMEKESDKEIYKYLVFSPTKGINITKNIIKNFIEENNNGTYNTKVVILKETNEIIGLYTIDFAQKIHNKADIGFQFAINSWNKGYATEATKAIINYIFNDLNIETVTANCATKSIASRKVLEKSGLKLIGTFKNWHNYHGITYDTHFFALSKNEKVNKAKVVLITGNKRAGKTTLSVKLHKEAGFNYYSFDNIMDAIEDSIEDVSNGFVFGNGLKNDMLFLENMVHYSLEQAKNYGISTVIDTIYYMPEDMINFKYKDQIEIYYIANLDAKEENIRKDFKKYSKSFDWPSYVSEEDIERNVKNILKTNEYLKEECSKYDFELINTSREDKREQILNDLFDRITNN